MSFIKISILATSSWIGILALSKWLILGYHLQPHHPTVSIFWKEPRLSVARANRADEPYARLPQRFLLAGRNILRTFDWTVAVSDQGHPRLVHCHIAKPPVQEVNAKIPKPVSDMILKLMAKNAEDRYQSAWGIKADLERCAQQLEKKLVKLTTSN